LLELLIAVAIFSIVLAAINAVFYGALRLRNKTTEAIQGGTANATGARDHQARPGQHRRAGQERSPAYCRLP
jgi:prepilin-type N-terminal cleavage/methylation domain-containing protein